MSNKEFWESISDGFDERFDRKTDYFGFDCLIELLGDISGKKILDYGCGEAQLTSRLTDKSDLVVGTDISTKALDSARKKFNKIENLKFLELSDPSLFKKGVYDICVSSFVFTCIEKKDNIYEIIKNIFYSLKKGGKFFILLPNPDAVGKQFYSFRCDPVGKIKDGSKVEYTLRGLTEKFPDFWWSDEFFKKLLEKIGFKSIKLHKSIPKDDKKWIDERSCPPFVIFESSK